VTAILVLHIFICFFLVGVILLQPGKGDAGVTFGSSSQSIFGSKGASNFLTKTTTACAIIFLATSLWLTRSRMKEFTSSVITDEKSAPTSAPTTTTPAAGAPATTPAPTDKKAEAPAPATK